jgi:hypothetical protein
MNKYLFIQGEMSDRDNDRLGPADGPGSNPRCSIMFFVFCCCLSIFPSVLKIPVFVCPNLSNLYGGHPVEAQL